MASVLLVLSLLNPAEPPTADDVRAAVEEVLKKGRLQPAWALQVLDPSRQPKEEWKQHRTIDLDKDGTPDLIIEYSHGSGLLSTYYSTYRIRAVSGYRLLKYGLPQAMGAKLTLADLAQTIDAAPLCTVGGSLRYPDKSFEEFSGGPWWKKEKHALALALVQGDEVKWGYVFLSVSPLGEVTAHELRLTAPNPSSLEVKAP